MSISFPSLPYDGQTFTDNNGRKWQYNLAKKSWKPLAADVYTKEEINQVVGLDSGGNYIVKGSSPNLTISDDISDIFSSLLNLEYGSVYINEFEPSEHSDGDLWFSLLDFTLRVSESGQFSQVYPDKVANASVSDSAPLNPNFGDLWWNSSEGTLKIYYGNPELVLGENWTLTASETSDDYIFSGSGFEIIEGDSANDPTITLYRGRTYYFDNQSEGHPFEIRTSDGGSPYTSGVSQSGTVTSFIVPEDAPDVLYYQCTTHPSMFGMFNIEDDLDSASEEFITVYDPIWIDVLGSNYSSSSSSNLGTSSIQWTRFYFDRGGSIPSAPIADSQNVGKNFGSWLEMTAGAVSGTTPTTGSSYTPTLSGITVNSDGEFELPAGVYEINVSLTYRIENNTSNPIKKNHYLYGQSGSDWAGSYDHHLAIVSTSNFSGLEHTINAGGVFVFENATQANNIVYLQMGFGNSPVEPNYYPDYGFLNIRKLG